MFNIGDKVVATKDITETIKKGATGIVTGYYNNSDTVPNNISFPYYVTFDMDDEDAVDFPTSELELTLQEQE